MITQYRYATSAFGLDTSWYSDPVSAAQGYLPRLPASGEWSDCSLNYSNKVTWPSGPYPQSPVFVQTSSGCTNSVGVGGGSGTWNYIGQAGTQSACPPNSSPDPSAPGTCTCGSGFVDDGSGQCLNPAAQICQLAKSAGLTDWATTSGQASYGSKTCMPNGCAATFGNPVWVQDKASGNWTTEGPVTYTGATCTYNPAITNTAGSGSTPGQAAPDPCRNGQPGTVNGVTVCIPYNGNQNVIQSVTSGTVTSSVTASTPGGTGTTSMTTATGTTTTSRCDGSSCATTQTSVVTASDGTTSTQTITATQSQATWCQQNPTDAACQASKSTWGGSCGGGYQCTGDAVSCAAAQAIWAQKCALVDGPSSPTQEQTDYAGAKAGGTGYSLTTSTVSISGANFDSSNALGVAGQCIGDVPVTVWGTSVTLPFSSVCPHLATLGAIMLGISWLLAAVIVGKGVQG